MAVANVRLLFAARVQGDGNRNVYMGRGSIPGMACQCIYMYHPLDSLTLSPPPDSTLEEAQQKPSTSSTQ
jgi:hypothetical protein